MLETFFFIPAHEKKFIKKIPEIDSDFFVLDLEESVSKNNKSIALNNLDAVVKLDNIWIRPFLFNNSGELDFYALETCISKGFKKFILPKISTLSEIHLIHDRLNQSLQDLSFILLVENARCLLNIQEIIQTNILKIEGVALGSHDYALATGMEHKNENLNFPRNLLLTIAKAEGVKAIDIASMDISDEVEFAEECKQALSLGYDAKFFLHPRQLTVLNSISFFLEDEIQLSLEIYEKLKNKNIEDFSIFTHKGKIYEKPHLDRILKIVNYYKENG